MIKRLALGLLAPSIEALPLSLEDEMRRSYLDYAMSVIMGRQESVQSVLGLHTYVRVFVRRVLGINSSPRCSELVERCGQWKVWDEPKPSLIYLLCQKARAPPDFPWLLQSV